jgi:hypothetical protein
LAAQLLNLADMSWELGQRPRANELACEALALSHELGSFFHLIHLLGLLAALAAGDGDIARAGRLWAAADALEESGQAVFQPGERDRYRQALLASPADELETAIAEGSALTLDQAVEFALA